MQRCVKISKRSVQNFRIFLVTKERTFVFFIYTDVFNRSVGWSVEKPRLSNLSVSANPFFFMKFFLKGLLSKSWAFKCFNVFGKITYALSDDEEANNAKKKKRCEVFFNGRWTKIILCEVFANNLSLFSFYLLNLNLKPSLKYFNKNLYFTQWVLT